MPKAPSHTTTTPAEGSDLTASPGSPAAKPKTTKATRTTRTTKAQAPKAPKAAASRPDGAKVPKAAASKVRARKVAVVPPVVDHDTHASDAGDEAFDRFVEAQRLELLAEREAYTRSARSLRAEAEELAQDREPGDVQFDEESGEGDSMNVERERDLALSAQALASVEEIDRALAKIEQGTYGVCEKCGEHIPRERLRALPHASLCVRCKSGGLSRR
ncbi:MAG: TraR/DksA C4-type zinc finger protein [Actinomycetota bacterium]|nr:TraR/DksA C4-type zinc finger protein [Actinomycetota bacterium]